MVGAVIIDVAFLVCGIVYVVWATPLEGFWQRHPNFPTSPRMHMFGYPPTARRYRIIGIIWIVIGVLMGYYLIKLSAAPQ